MTDYKKFTTEQPLVAIDVAKRFHDVLVRWPEGKTKAFKAANRREEHVNLCAFLHAQNRPVTVAPEATADFHRPIAYARATAGLTVHLASSLACARVREALYNSGINTTARMPA